MLISLPGRDQSTEAWAAETFSALARMPVEGPEPVVWPFTPYYTGNPYQNVLYSRFGAHGLVAAPTFRATDLLTTTRDWPGDVPLVVHLHWLNQVLAKADSESGANDAINRHADLLDTLKERGARLVWTVHNVLPHDTRFEAQEVRLREQVVERADLVHVMSSRTPQAVEDWFSLPREKVYQLDHPGYQGVYPDWIGRDEARRRLRVPDGAVALLLTGAVKPYKGLADLLEAVDRVSRVRPGEIVLIVAGRPDQAPETEEFVARAASHPAVRLLPVQVPDVDMQVLMRAADLVALPYRRSLNSGVLALALTFGRPALLPSNSGSLPVVEGGAALVYPPDGVEALTDAVFRCLDADLGALDRAAEAAGQRIDRAVIAERFAADMRTWVDTGVVPSPVDEVAPVDGAAGVPPGVSV
ncbi:glycosyltransferase [Kineosporia succinea]|uniref:Glycosyltransferase involved in cell wall biosynthesis n=1 Tax=Kineosporia succinea TaxID=84632 RepID=A0ABT9NZM7_9ACTN|nr:glycosyltransferase [Kineosporia succinea]MDP9825420.1 glycosyltransferase involved in cell wall biosynthesis [Kineosporia succinea]